MDIIDIIIYVAILISGTVFGSFFTLAVHRIPKGEDITHERSYCPKCNHKLGFWDMIPVFSYIFLGGKCRYCKEKIRPRYLILELLSGLLFVLIALKCGISYYTSSIQDVAYFCLIILFMVCLVITAGIDKELHKIYSGVILYGALIAIVKILFFTYYYLEVINNIITFFAFAIIWLLLSFIEVRVKAHKKEPIDESKKELFYYFLNVIKYLGVIGLFYFTPVFLMGFIIYVLINLAYDLVNLFIKSPYRIPQGMLISIIYIVLYLVV